MPKAAGLLYYWDACVFLSAIDAVPDRISTIEAIMSLAAKGEVRIATSTLSVVEVSFAKSEKANQVLDEGVERRIGALWSPGSPILLCDVHPAVAHGAWMLMRRALEDNWKLKPADAIHLATAKLLQAAAFHTYDEKLFKFASILTIPIEAPISDALPFRSPISPR